MIDHREVGRYWEGNAEAWTRLARAGYDVCRDYANTPGFLAMLPEVTGLLGLDIGCGEGGNTRQVVRRGAQMVAMDISPTFVRHACEAGREANLPITHVLGSAVQLPFATGTFDFATAFMCLMDIGETPELLGEAYRVLRPGGFLQFSITHPCTDVPHRRKLRNAAGEPYAYELGGYFNGASEVQEWSFSAAPPEAREGLAPFRVPRFTRTLSSWLNLLLDTGFVLERFGEPRPDAAALAAQPELVDMTLVPYYLIMRCRKPMSSD